MFSGINGSWNSHTPHLFTMNVIYFYNEKFQKQNQFIPLFCLKRLHDSSPFVKVHKSLACQPNPPSMLWFHFMALAVFFFFFMHILSLNLYSSRMKLGPAGPLLDSQDLASRLAHDRCSININERLSEHPHHLLLLPIYISPTQPISLCDVPTLIEMLSW